MSLQSSDFGWGARWSWMRDEEEREAYSKKWEEWCERWVVREMPQRLQKETTKVSWHPGVSHLQPFRKYAEVPALKPSQDPVPWSLHLASGLSISLDHLVSFLPKMTFYLLFLLQLPWMTHLCHFSLSLPLIARKDKDDWEPKVSRWACRVPAFSCCKENKRSLYLCLPGSLTAGPAWRLPGAAENQTVLQTQKLQTCLVELKQPVCCTPKWVPNLDWWQVYIASSRLSEKTSCTFPLMQPCHEKVHSLELTTAEGHWATSGQELQDISGKAANGRDSWLPRDCFQSASRVPLQAPQFGDEFEGARVLLSRSD